MLLSHVSRNYSEIVSLCMSVFDGERDLTVDNSIPDLKSRNTKFET